MLVNLLLAGTLLAVFSGRPADNINATSLVEVAKHAYNAERTEPPWWEAWTSDKQHCKGRWVPVGGSCHGTAATKRSAAGPPCLNMKKEWTKWVEYDELRSGLNCWLFQTDKAAPKRSDCPEGFLPQPASAAPKYALNDKSMTSCHLSPEVQTHGSQPTEDQLNGVKPQGQEPPRKVAVVGLQDGPLQVDDQGKPVVKNDVTPDTSKDVASEPNSKQNIEPASNASDNDDPFLPGPTAAQSRAFRSGFVDVIFMCARSLLPFVMWLLH